MYDSLIFAAMVVPCIVVAIVFHEVAHGYAAKALGDPTASERGRLTLNPIKHVDPIGTLLVPAGLLLLGGPPFGWAKPVPVNQRRLDNPRFGMMAVAAAGPGINFVLATLSAFLLASFGQGVGLVEGPGGLVFVADAVGETLTVETALLYFVLINLFLGLFNLLPIPPFDGSHIVGGLLPDRLRRHWARLQNVGVLLIVGVIAYSWIFGTGWLEVTILPLVDAAFVFLFGLFGYNPGFF
ncbi:site-2 protease family protein [Erythrobacter sp. KY5]|uniref:site-2 protease family protein n=1 Tax=Erythrobacter sp. KY5 TaxID=2011159 RepID=UPI000DBF1028|nr:site-2 protease family protein [Erythrobacter sp. KY5]AWW75449.1 site-2 protease family protein [Erythrobacter sp. KY5]